jgi:3-oxoacyl-[acyl-carrier-protein] synthase-3
MIGTAEALLKSLGMTLADVDLVVPHQPNKRLLDRLGRLAGIPEHKLFVNVDTVGNTSGAACGIALDHALAQGRAPAGSKVLLLAAGAGYTAGAALIHIDAELVDAVRRARA